MPHRDSTKSGWKRKAHVLPRLTHLMADLKFERLPFDLVSGPEIFQRVMNEMFEDIERCKLIVDDLLVWR